MPRKRLRSGKGKARKAQTPLGAALEVAKSSGTALMRPTSPTPQSRKLSPMPSALRFLKTKTNTSLNGLEILENRCKRARESHFSAVFWHIRHM